MSDRAQGSESFKNRSLAKAPKGLRAVKFSADSIRLRPTSRKPASPLFQGEFPLRNDEGARPKGRWKTLAPIARLTGGHGHEAGGILHIGHFDQSAINPPLPDLQTFIPPRHKAPKAHNTERQTNSRVKQLEGLFHEQHENTDHRQNRPCDQLLREKKRPRCVLSPPCGQRDSFPCRIA